MRYCCGGLAAGSALMWFVITGAAQNPGATSDGLDAHGDPLPQRALARLGTSRWRHGSRIETIAFAPSGKLIAAAGGNDPIRLWDAVTGRELRACNEPWTYALAFSTRGTVLFSGGALKVIRMWDTDTAKEFAQLTAHQAAIKALAVSPDGSMLASADDDGEVILWEIIHRKIMARFKGHQGAVTSLAFSPDRDSVFLVSGSRDRTVRVWHVDQQKMVHQIDAGAAVADVAFVDEKTIAVAGDAAEIRLWNVESAQPLAALPGHAGGAAGVVATRDGKRLISSGHDAMLRVWDVSARREILKIEQHQEDGDALAISKDGKLVACGGGNHALRVFHTDSGQEQFKGLGAQAGLAYLALTTDARTLASISTAGSITIWDRDTGKPRRTWETPHRAESVLAFSPDGNLLASGGKNQPVRFWDVAAGKEIGQLPAKEGDPLLALAFAPQGGLFAAGYRLGSADVWNLQEKKVVVACKLPIDGGVQALAFDQSGSQLALGGLGKIALWDIAAGKQLRVFDSKEEGGPHSAPAVACLAFSPDGKTLAAGCYDSVVRLIDRNKGKELRALEGHASVPYSLAFSADGRILASGSFDKTVRFWEAFSGLTIAALTGHQGPVHAVALSPDGRQGFSASADSSILHWDVTGRGREGFKPSENPIADFSAAWVDLASEDTGRGHRAMWNLLVHADTALPLLGKQVYLINPRHIEQLFKDLNSETFSIRDKASRELEKYGRWMEGRYNEALTNPQTLEVQRRVERLKDALKGGLSLEQERIRARRVLLILEQSGNPAARAVLETLVAGAPEPDLQREAKQSLERLAKRL